MGNRGSSDVGGDRRFRSKQPQLRATATSKFMRKGNPTKQKQQQQQHQLNSSILTASAHHHHPNNNNHHQYANHHHLYQQAPARSTISPDLSGSQQLIWLTDSTAAPSPYYLDGSRGAQQQQQRRRAKNRATRNHHYDPAALHHEPSYQDLLGAAEASQYPHEHYTSVTAANGGGGSSQTYRSTPIASSSSQSSHSTAAAGTTTATTLGPGDDVDPELYCDQSDCEEHANDLHHLSAASRPLSSSSHLSHQLHSTITQPPTRCLDPCCNPTSHQVVVAAKINLTRRQHQRVAYSPATRRHHQRQQTHLQFATSKRNAHLLSATTAPKSASRRAQVLQATTTTMNSNGISKQQDGGGADGGSTQRPRLDKKCPLSASLERGLALDEEERQRLGLAGLLPAVVQDQELQSRAVMNFLENCQDELGKYVYLRHLKDFNEKLFYFTLTRNVVKLMPLVYTPTVGLACQKFSEIYMRPRGMWVTARDSGRIRQIIENWPERDVRVIVVTDGERILGLGDLGANGMGISVGKLSLYTALAGIAPANVLPVTIDVGTQNENFLRDPFYIGLRQERLRGSPYESLIEEFMQEVVERWGRSCLIQFEDFANSTAFNLLKRYRQQYCTFNDDIQGTASVALSGLITAAKQTGQRLSDCTFLFYGAGEANLGTAQLMIMAMLDEGTPRAEAKKRIWLVDSKGLVVASRSDLNEHKLELAQEASKPQLKSLEEIIDLVRPTAIIGASAQGGSFTKAICQKMAQHNDRPIIFALSNPTSKAECTAEQAYEWTQGKCVFASGSPFEPVEFGGKTYVTGQGNNAYIFPGVGLAAIGAHTHIIPEETFLVAARALSDQVTQADIQVGLVYPSLTNIREVTLKVATRVLEYFYAERMATYRPEPSDKRAFLEAIQYDPRY